MVVGGGAAGLRAAADLGTRGLRVAVLEARDRLGGRIHTIRPQGWPDPIELGPEFVHGGNEDLLQLLRRGRAKRRPVADHHWISRRGVVRPAPDAWERIDAILRRIGPRFRGSFADWLRQQPDLARDDALLVGRFVEGFEAAPMNRMSASVLRAAASAGEGEQFRVTGGYDRIVVALEREVTDAGVAVHRGTVVSRIRWRHGRVELTAGKRVWRARAALVTVPLGVLRARPPARGAIRFEPALPAKARLVRQLGAGHACRVLLRFQAPAWPDLLATAADGGPACRRGFLHSDQRDFPVWWFLSPDPIVVGWSAGPAAARLAGRPEGEVIRRALRSLAAELGLKEKRIRAHLADARTYDWDRDPFTRGAYSFAAAGAERGPGALARPIKHTLFFAGEATADLLDPGTVHGALASGRRAAREILTALTTDAARGPRPARRHGKQPEW